MCVFFIFCCLKNNEKPKTRGLCHIPALSFGRENPPAVGTKGLGHGDSRDHLGGRWRRHRVRWVRSCRSCGPITPVVGGSRVARGFLPLLCPSRVVWTQRRAGAPRLQRPKSNPCAFEQRTPPACSPRPPGATATKQNKIKQTKFKRYDQRLLGPLVRPDFDPSLLAGLDFLLGGAAAAARARDAAAQSYLAREVRGRSQHARTTAVVVVAVSYAQYETVSSGLAGGERDRALLRVVATKPPLRYLRAAAVVVVVAGSPSSRVG